MNVILLGGYILDQSVLSHHGADTLGLAVASLSCRMAKEAGCS